MPERGETSRDQTKLEAELDQLSFGSVDEEWEERGRDNGGVQKGDQVYDELDELSFGSLGDGGDDDDGDSVGISGKVKVPENQNLTSELDQLSLDSSSKDGASYGSESAGSADGGDGKPKHCEDDKEAIINSDDNAHLNLPIEVVFDGNSDTVIEEEVHSKEGLGGGGEHTASIRNDLAENLSSFIEELDGTANTGTGDLRRWAIRVENKNFYDANYRSVPREIREIEDLANQCLFPRRGGEQGPSSRSMLDQSTTVLLKREPIIFQRINHGQDDVHLELAHLILLNRCFIVLPEYSQSRGQKEEDGGGSSKRSLKLGELKRGISEKIGKLVGRRKGYECFHPLSSILGIVDEEETASTSGRERVFPSFGISVRNGMGDKLNYRFYCFNEERRNSWMDSMRTSVKLSHAAMKERMDNGSLADQGRQSAEMEEVSKSAAAAAAVERSGAEVSAIMSGFLERGERLEEVDCKSSQLKDEAKNYGELTTQLKERMEKKNKNWFGI